MSSRILSCPERSCARSRSCSCGTRGACGIGSEATTSNNAAPDRNGTDVLPDPFPHSPASYERGYATAVSLRPTWLVLQEAGGGALLLSGCAIVLAVLGLTPGLQWIPEAPLLSAAVLAPVGICGVSGYRAARRARRVLAGAVAGALAGAAGGGVGGLCYVFFGKSALNVAAGIVLGLIGGAAIGAAAALFGQRAAQA